MTWFKWSRTAATNSTADSTVNWAEGQAPSSVNDSARAMMAAAAKYRDDISGVIATGGTSTAYTVTSYQGFTTLALMDGAMIAFTPNATSGATPTLNVDSLGAKALRSAPSVELPVGALVAGRPYAATYYHAATEWILQGIVTPIGATRQTFTSGSSATYTTPTGCKRLYIRMIGAGGGGAGSGNTSSGQVGGGTGGTTSFNSITAIGGTGGAVNNSTYAGEGGVGGTGGSGTALRFRGASGAGGYYGSAAIAQSPGAGSPFTGGSYGTPAPNSGAGGYGGSSGNTTLLTTTAGGGGAGEYAEFAIASPSATYTYSVGAGGTAGTAGSNGANGLVAAAGIIIVDESYYY